MAMTTSVPNVLVKSPTTPAHVTGGVATRQPATPLSRTCTRAPRSTAGGGGMTPHGGGSHPRQLGSGRGGPLGHPSCAEDDGFAAAKLIDGTRALRWKK